jgi:glutamine amidotransferase-like uncharacterized protein
MLSRFFQIFIPFLFPTIVVVSCSEDDVTAPIEEITVALYAGRGADDDCITAADNMFEWMGLNVERVGSSLINTSSLDRFDLICFPGGDMYSYSQDISAGGKAKIKQFIADGGGYIGICGGAYFAASRVFWRGNRLDMIPLSLFKGSATGPINDICPYPDYGMTQLNVLALNHPITSDGPAFMSVLYYWGPYLTPDTDFEYDLICTYDVTGLKAMVAFDHGKGKVFLTGAHPEFEEDSDRDGVNFCDDLDDDGSDWNFMKRAAHWCLKKI